MSHTNSTTNYGLPEFLSSDKPAWMGDMNPAFSEIDAQMKLIADAAAQANTDIGTVGLNFAAGYSNASTYDVGDVVTYNKRMYICDVAVTVPEAFDNSKWSYYKCSDIVHTAKEAEASASAVAGNVSDINDAIGNTDISAIGDGTLTGAISSVNANLSNKSSVTIDELFNDTVSSQTYQISNVTQYDFLFIEVYSTSGNNDSKLVSAKQTSNMGFYTDDSRLLYAMSMSNTTSFNARPQLGTCTVVIKGVKIS